jgi:hypothetical protein
LVLELEGSMTKRPASDLAAPFGDVAPRSDHDAQGRGVVIARIAAWLEKMVRHYDSREWAVGANGLERTQTFAISAFHGRPLSTSIEGFLRRIYTLAKLEETVILVAAVYMQRIVEKCPGLPISSCTVHRLLLSALTVGAKFSLDRPRSNKTMASFVGMPPKKFNQNEVKFLCLMQYDLNVSPEEIASVKNFLGVEEPRVEAPACKKIKLGSSGGTTYSTIDVLAAGMESGEESGADEMSRLMDKDSTVDEMSHVEEPNNYNTVEVGGQEVDIPCLSDVSAATSPEWSNSSGCNTPQEAGTPLCTGKKPVQGFLANATKGDASSPEPTKMSTPERQTALRSLVAIAAE